MQGLGSRHGSDSTINDFELHRSSTPQNPPASSSSTLVNGTTFASNAASFSDISSASSASSVVDSTPPWWEAQAEHILRGSDLQAIRLLCRYHVYGENSIPESILRKRWGPRLNSFLLVLNPYNRHEINEFSLDQKVSEILTHLVPSVPSTSNSRDLASPSLLLESYSSCLASKLDEESLLRRRKVTFADCVSEALYPGKTVESIENFIDWHDTLYNIVSDRLEEYPDEVVKYAQIEQRLHEGSPVRWAVSQSLQQAQSYHPRELAPQPSLDFIIEPLRDLFQTQHRDLAGILTRLAVLEARFQQNYMREEEIDWTHTFDTNTEFFDSVTTIPPHDFADLLTQGDLVEFRKLSPQDVIHEGFQLHEIHKRWNRLCRAVQESITANNGLRPVLVNLAKELHIRHNYYSLCAVLQALRETFFDESQLPHIFILIDTDRNYASYRKAYAVTLGLPFLPAHIRRLGHYKETALAEIFSFVSYKLVQDKKPEPGRRKQENVGKKLSWSAFIWATFQKVFFW